MRTNASIKAHYEKGHDYTSDGDEESGAILEYLRAGQSILEIGCGSGSLALTMAETAKRITAIDYVRSANWPRKTWGHKTNYMFSKAGYKQVTGPYDTVVMKGVLEHMDSPEETLTFIAENFKTNQIITSSPSFLNPRGYIWMALQYLFDFEMSLADLHFILPSEMEAWAEKLGYDIEYKSVDQDWGHGERLIEDFKKRLPKAINIEADIPKFMAWLEKTLPYQNYTESSGATIVYNLRRT